MSFGTYPLTMNLQESFFFDIGNTRVSATPEFSIEKDFSVLFFDEDKHFHGRIGPSNEYGECQIAAEALACAYRNFSDVDNVLFEQDQVIYATRVIGTRFTFYKAFISAQYLRSIANGPPQSERVTILRFPSNAKSTRLGLDFADPSIRPTILSMLSNLYTSLVKFSGL